jgi:ferredoxin
MIPYQGALTIPRIHPEICVGCGGCEFICPVQPHTAIYVEGLQTQQKAKAIVKEAKKDVQLNDFGF